MPISSKIVCYNSIVRALLCYGAQVWGFVNSKTIESGQNCFIRKLFKLPKNTPNYVLYLECQFEKVYFYALSLHFSYIIKALLLPNYRLPCILAKQIIRKDIFWFKEITKMSERRGIQLNFDANRLDIFQSRLMDLLKLERADWWRECEGWALTNRYILDNKS